MNYAEARELSDGTGWHFTIRNDDRVWAHECCRELREATVEDVVSYEGMGFDLKVGELIPDGPHEKHNSKAEAEACFNRWRRKPERFKVRREVSDWHGCEICDEPTKDAVVHSDLGGQHYFFLCEDHLSVEEAIQLVEDATYIIYL